MNFRRARTDTIMDIIPPEQRGIAIRSHAFAGAEGILDVEFETVRGAFGKPGLVEAAMMARPVAKRSVVWRGSLPRLECEPLVRKYGFPVVVVTLSLATFWISGGHALAERSALAGTGGIVAGDKAD